MTAGDLTNRTLQELDEIDLGATAATPVYYGGPSEVLNALNEAQRFFALLTLGLEATASFAIPAPPNTFFHMLAYFPDWLLPLRMSLTSGTRVRPARLAELDALDAGWQARAGTPARYAALGFDFLAVTPQPAEGLEVSVTYARSPVEMQATADIPEIPEQHHPDLADYAVYRLRMKEGGREFQKGLVYFNRFLDGAEQYGNYVRARNIGARYDKQPFELERYDRSHLLALRADLIPIRSVS